jgi:hypothetical protein
MYIGAKFVGRRVLFDHLQISSQTANLRLRLRRRVQKDRLDFMEQIWHFRGIKY